MQVRRFCAQQLKCHTEVPKIPRQLTQFTFLGIMTNVHNAYDDYDDSDDYDGMERSMAQRATVPGSAGTSWICNGRNGTWLRNVWKAQHIHKKS